MMTFTLGACFLAITASVISISSSLSRLVRLVEQQIEMERKRA